MTTWLVGCREGMNNVEKKVSIAPASESAWPMVSAQVAADLAQRMCERRTSTKRLVPPWGDEPAPATVGPVSAGLRGAAHRPRGEDRQATRTQTGPDERWTSLLECEGDPVVVTDADGLILHAYHPPSRPALGVVEIVGGSIYELLLPAFRAGMRQALESVFRAGRATRQVVCLSTPEHAASICEARLGPITENGQTIAAGVFFADITERERLRDKLRECETLLRSIVTTVPKTMEIFENLLRYGTNSREPAQRRAEAELYRQHLVQIERLVVAGNASLGLTQKLPQFLTAIRLSVENALASLETVSLLEGVRQELEAALRTVSTLTQAVKQVRAFAQAGTRRASVHAVNVRTILVKVVRLLETNARQTDTPICTDDLGELALVHMAEGDAEQLFFSLLENIICLAPHERHHPISVSGTARDHTVELRFSGPCAPCEGGHPDGVEHRRSVTRPEYMPAHQSLHVAWDITARAGGTIRTEHTGDGRMVFSVVLPTADQAGSSPG